jgi:hypothetical protein
LPLRKKHFRYGFDLRVENYSRRNKINLKPPLVKRLNSRGMAGLEPFPFSHFAPISSGMEIPAKRAFWFYNPAF